MTSAWECEACGKLHALKARADACCLCKTCGKQPSVYTGNNNDCEMCHAEKHLADARLCLANGEKMVADAEKRVAVLKRRAAERAGGQKKDH